MSKHTQGDWYTKREGFSTVYVFCRISGGIVQEVAACGPTNEGQEQQEANARLIASAPDLFGALANLLQLLPSGTTNPAIQAARQAIAKATGEQQ